MTPDDYDTNRMILGYGPHDWPSEDTVRHGMSETLKTTIDGLLNSDPYEDLSDEDVQRIYDEHWKRLCEGCNHDINLLTCRHYGAVIEYRRRNAKKAKE